MARLRVTASIELVVECPSECDQLDSQEVCQLVQDDVGHTGAVVVDVVEWQELEPGE